MPADEAPQSSIILYQTDDGRTRIQCRFEDETIWLTQALIAELYQKDVRTINEHLVNVFDEGELSREATIRKFRIVRREGAREVAREIEHYSLPAILAVGYRVRSPRGTQFRQWATARLNEYLVKGFTLDDERLKNTPGPGYTDYFDELLERIRDIRASERRMYLRVREILALAADYSPSDPESRAFFQTVQSKLHFAVTGKTAPELIAERADSSQPNMGLTAWKGGVVRKSDVTVAKNYLREEEIAELNRIVVMFLDFAEGQGIYPGVRAAAGATTPVGAEGLIARGLSSHPGRHLCSRGRKKRLRKKARPGRILMKRVWIVVVCTCTLALVSTAGFAETPSADPLTGEVLAAILGPSAVSPSCAALRGEPVFAAQKAGGRPGGVPKTHCNATASCASGTVSCSGHSICSVADRDCLSCEQGHVTCDGVTTWCPTACNCNSFFGTQKWCCLCACNGDCFSCCRCDGGGAGQCAFQCG